MVNKSNKFILTIDLSTTTLKINIFDIKGNLIYNKKDYYASKNPKLDWFEIDAKYIWKRICINIKSLLEEIDNYKIEGVGITAQLGLVPVNYDCKAIGPILTWRDQRAINQADQIVNHIGNKTIYKLTGRRVSPELSAPKILWFKENNFELYKKTYKFLSLKDYLISKFTGKMGIDPAHASYTMLYNITKGKWEEQLISELKIEKNKLPKIFECNKIIGKTTKSVAQEIGLEEGIPVVVGGPDGSIGTLSARLYEKNSAINILGTTDVFFASSETPIFDDKMRIVINRHLIPGLWSIGGPMSTSCGCFEWFIEQFGTDIKGQKNRVVYDNYNKKAEEIEMGADKLLFYTSLVGERAPYWNYNMKGSIIGLTPKHTQSHIIRALFEGTSFAVKQIIDIIEDIGIQIDEIYLIGGGSKSNVWGKIRANITGKKFIKPKIEDSVSLGTFISVAVGLGIYSDFFEAQNKLVKIKHKYLPEKDKNQKYKSIYETYCRIHKKLEEAYNIW